jgi:hypothetical protein
MKRRAETRTLSQSILARVLTWSRRESVECALASCGQYEKFEA